MDPLLSLFGTDEALKPMIQMAADCASSNISTIRTLVMKVLTDPKIHCGFDQIKDKLKEPLASGSEGEIMMRTLDLFSYGNYKDYVNAESGYFLTLTEAQVFKLRQLSILSLVQKSCLEEEQAGILTYESMKQEINSEDMEDVVISCIYAGLIVGKLCQKRKSLIVSSARGPPCRSRDVPFSQTGFLLEKLKKVSTRLDNTLSQLEASKLQVQAHKEEHDKFWRQVELRKNSKAGVAGGMDQWGTAGMRRGSSARSSKRSRGGLAPDSVGRL
uniref:PCI domain-containing protein n=1 Tax=Cyclophora tenuis TaxID=216820 RepID=A0A7S1D9A6_CYCTE|mmetsp:Transcript_2681/g.4604  ORF Transcript_2681/g.4604 Transcript_2681/m.4604 type:complete len:272 (+) Transcript_2681:68-883(+)